jgi:hypothetical protein
MNEGEVYFRLFADRFDPALVTERLQMAPTRTSLKADPRPKGTSWILSTGKIRGEVVDIYEMSTSLVAQLAPCAEEIRALVDELGLTAVLHVVLRINMDESASTPAIGFDSRTVEFLSKVRGSIDVDTYRA